jgi:hypothetical protein
MASDRNRKLVDVAQMILVAEEAMQPEDVKSQGDKVTS